ncbi:MAG TPA: SRPBCC family protein [Burkholderiales bacterium]
MAEEKQETPRRGVRRGPAEVVQTTVASVAEIPERERPTRETAAPERALRTGGGPPTNIGTTERTLSMVGGGLLVVQGLRRRSWLTALPLIGLGGALAWRGATGRSKVYRRMGVRRAEEPVTLAQTVTVNRPPEDVYRFWRQLENLPKFMRHIARAEQLSATRSRWSVQAGVLGRAVEWESEIVEDRPNELIRWRTLPDGAVQHSGEVRFVPAPGNRGTEVHVRIEYRPAYGTAIAALTYPMNKQTLREEVRRLKQVLEAGEVPTVKGQPSGRRARRMWHAAPGGAP